MSSSLVNTIQFPPHLALAPSRRGIWLSRAIHEHYPPSPAVRPSPAGPSSPWLPPVVLQLSTAGGPLPFSSKSRSQSRRQSGDGSPVTGCQCTTTLGLDFLFIAGICSKGWARLWPNVQLPIAVNAHLNLVSSPKLNKTGPDFGYGDYQTLVAHWHNLTFPHRYQSMLHNA